METKEKEVSSHTKESMKQLPEMPQQLDNKTTDGIEGFVGAIAGIEGLLANVDKLKNTQFYKQKFKQLLKNFRKGCISQVNEYYEFAEKPENQRIADYIKVTAKAHGFLLYCMAKLDPEGKARVLEFIEKEILKKEDRVVAKKEKSNEKDSIQGVTQMVSEKINEKPADKPRVKEVKPIMNDNVSETGNEEVEAPEMTEGGDNPLEAMLKVRSERLKKDSSSVVQYEEALAVSYTTKEMQDLGTEHMAAGGDETGFTDFFMNRSKARFTELHGSDKATHYSFGRIDADKDKEIQNVIFVYHGKETQTNQSDQEVTDNKEEA